MRLEVYEDIKKIFESEQKVIWLVKHQITGEFYVKKIISDTSNVALYEQLKKVQHPNIVSMIDYEVRDHKIYAIEEFLNGVTLAYQMSVKPLENAQIQMYMTQLMDALSYLHHVTPPIIHRDIKPDNIYIVQGSVKLMDFEIARTVKTDKQKDTRLMGSIGFASPEHYGFRQCDERSDMYSLGVVLKSMVQHNIDTECIHSPYRECILRCMQLDPENRYQNIEEMKDDFPLLEKEVNLVDQKTKAVNSQLGRFPGFGNESALKKTGIYTYIGFTGLVSCFINVENGSSLESAMLKVCTFLAFMIALWIFAGRGRLHTSLPLIRSKYLILRLIGGYIVWFVVIFIFMIFIGIIITPLESML